MAPKRSVVALLLLALLLGGCWDRMEIEDEGYIVALGLDDAGQNQLLVTAALALPQPLATGILGPQVRPREPRVAALLLTARAGTITQALHVLNGSSTRRLDLKHLRAVVVGEPLARRGLEPVVMELHRGPLSRATALLVQARGSAYRLLPQLQPVDELNPGRMVEGAILQAKLLHLAPPVRMHHFIMRLAATGIDPFVPAMAVNPRVRQGVPALLADPGRSSALPGELPRAGGNPVEFNGSAIFRRDRLVGYLSVDETQMLLALRGEMGKAYVTFPDPRAPDQPVTMRFHMENKPRHQVSWRGARPAVHTRLLLEGEVLALPSGIDYSQPPARRELELAANRFAGQTAHRMLNKLKRWGADPVGYGLLFRSQFATWPQWQAYGWARHVRDLQVDVTVRMRIRRYGLVIGSDRTNRAE